MIRTRSLLASLFALALAAGVANAEVLWQSISVAFPRNTYEVRFALVLPDDFDPARPHPVMLAIPPGRGDEMLVKRGLFFWEEGAERNGWVVVSPTWVNERPFYESGHAVIPALVEWMKDNVRIEGGRPHLTGISLGGVAAYIMAIEYTDLFASLTTLPGTVPPSEADRLENLRDLPMTNYVGEYDKEYGPPAARLEQIFAQMGAEYERIVMPREKHALRSLEDGETLFENLDEHRTGRRTLEPEAAAASAAVTALHEAAASADAETYFSLFTDDAVFLGTDPQERWTLEQFRAYAEPHFEGESAWIYHALRRDVRMLGEDAAAFDETLINDKYGLCRGTGALRRVEGEWKITQYNLSIPIPNALVDEMIDPIREKATTVEAGQ